MPTFNINANEVVQLTNKLEKMHRSALPVSVRGALNAAAFDMKNRTVKKHFENNNFIIRAPKFVTSHTRVNKSPNTFDIKQMRSSAGILKGKSKSGDQLEKQERGGTITQRGAIPLQDARVSASTKKRVKKTYYYNLYNQSKRGRIQRTAKETLIKTDRSLLSVRKGGKWKTLYRIKGQVNITKAPFIQPAGDDSAKRIPEFYKKELQKKIK